MWSKCDIRIRTLLYYILSLSTLCSGYVITTPKRWTSGEESQVCVMLSAPAAVDQTITFEMKRYFSTILIPRTFIVVPQGSQSICQNIFLPSKYNYEYEGEIRITGSLEEKRISYTKYVVITSEIVDTFIETDKQLYKPSQTVQFRIITLTGVFLKVSLKPYKEIVIQSPSGIRLAQWIDVENNKGLIHLSFQLSDEPEEGKYQIKVRTSSGKFYAHIFEVKEYVLPRLEVTITPPSYILGTTEIITFKVCARYTFGEPVNGNVSISVDNNKYRDSNVIIEKKDEISGCKTFDFIANELYINDYKDKNSWYLNHAYSLTANAVVIEEGTGITSSANKVTVQISRTALKFIDISAQKYYKPELPFVGEVKVTFPDGSPTSNERMKACCSNSCKDFSTDAGGVLIFALPPNPNCNIRISAPGYPYLKSNVTGRAIMFESSYYGKSSKKYYSPSKSSLIIFIPNEALECTSTKYSIFFNLTVMYAVSHQASAFVTVQVVSRGQIQFSKTFIQTFPPDSTESIPEEWFIVPYEGSTIPGLVKGSFNVEISLPKTVSPEAQVLVWYTRSDGEVVSDARDISIMKCLLNSVNVKWSTKKSQPGSDVSLTVKAEPLSLCSLGVVDKSVELLTHQNYLLTIQNLLKLAQRGSVNSYDKKQVDDESYCSEQKRKEKLSDPLSETPSTLQTDFTTPTIFTPGGYFYYTSSDIDALKMFDEAGIYCLSDHTVETRPCDIEHFNYYYDYYYDSYGYFGATFLSVTSATVEYATADYEEESEADPIRTFFPETWIWNLFDVSIDGKFEENLTLPDTVTEWVGSAVCVHPSKGVGISSTASITAFKMFFVDLNLPPSVKRGEVFHVKISIFNYLSESLPIKLTLESPDDQFYILADSGDIGGSEERTTCVPENDKTVLTIRIRAKEVGDVNISVKAIVEPNAVKDCGSGNLEKTSDHLIKPIRVKFEGLLKEETESRYVCIKDSETVSETSTTTPDLIARDSGIVSASTTTTTYFSTSTTTTPDFTATHSDTVSTTTTTTPDSTATDSETVSTTTTTTPDFTATDSETVSTTTTTTPDSTATDSETVSTTTTTAPDLIATESETDSETFSVTTPASIIPDSARGFVALTGDLIAPTIENLGNLIRMPYGCGEQNMLNFAPNIFIMQYLDASNQNTDDVIDRAIEFMKKGYQQELKYQHKDGSFSAFGESDVSGSTWLTAFVLKCFGQASPYISINSEELNIIRNWLMSKQQNNGCFKSVGNVFNKAMQGGSGSTSPLTAYVLIALIESGESSTSIAVGGALSCINGVTVSNTDPYNLAIKAYASALANCPITAYTLKQLFSLSTTSNSLLFWEFTSEFQSSKGVAVETASYAVLAILTFERNSMNFAFTQYVFPIIRWINTQRNGQGGFISTQDTVIAFQALAAYQKTISSQGSLNLSVSVTMGSVEKSFNVNDQNSLVQQSVEFPEVPTQITVKIDGNGCVLIQSVLRYNVPDSKPSEEFSLRVTTSTEPDNKCITKRINVCAAYLLPDQNSNMAIIEIDLVSGYIAEEEDLEKIIDNEIGLFKLYEIDGSTIIIYVDEFSAKEICVSFRVHGYGEIENPKPGTVEVYDYYIPEYLVSKTYTLPPETECIADEKEELSTQDYK